jgi:hypothetical protein
MKNTLCQRYIKIIGKSEVQILIVRRKEANMALSDIKDVATIVGAVIALLALIKGLVEYIKQGAQKRAEHFLTMRKRLKENDVFKHICELLEMDDPELINVPFKDKRDFLGLFEEVAIGMNSGLIRLAVAHYMFGYYAIRC